MRPLLADGTQPGTSRIALPPRHCTPIDPKPCSARLSNGGWCIAEDGHGGAHGGVPRQAIPTPASKLFGPSHIAEANARRSKR